MCGFNVTKSDLYNKIDKTDIVNALAVSSYCIIVKKTKLRMNTNYEKYKFDYDFCLRMWEEHNYNKRVIVSPFSVAHLDENRYTLRSKSTTSFFRKIRHKDTALLKEHWSSKKQNIVDKILKNYPSIKLVGSSIV